MLPQYRRLDAARGGHDPSRSGARPRLQVPYDYFTYATVSLPLAGFFFCVGWSLAFDFQRSTQTHCGVPNTLPSISAAIGNYQPQRFVWQSAILLAALPRLWICCCYVLLYGRVVRNSRRPLAYFGCLFNAVENVALVGLSLFTSAADYEAHKFCFVLFVATSEIYMVVTWLVNQAGRKPAAGGDALALRSLRVKRAMCVVNVGAFAVAGYCFVRHNERCEPYSEYN